MVEAVNVMMMLGTESDSRSCSGEVLSLPAPLKITAFPFLASRKIFDIPLE